jgi:ribosomal RNA assembly protein
MSIHPNCPWITNCLTMSGHNKYRKDKPWDNDPTLDKWKPVPIDDSCAPLQEQSSFATLFPSYREQYIQQIFPKMKEMLHEVHVNISLDLREGSLTVSTTKKTIDPFIILKARDMIKLISRSVPLEKARKVLNDTVYCDIVKISGMVRNKEKFVKRRQRLIGPNGSTLKALELLTECYILVQGQTVSIIGEHKGLKIARRVVEGTMKNQHPVYFIKELMIKRELAKNPEMANEDWSKFIPKFKSSKNMRKASKKPSDKKQTEKELFPAQPLPREEDLKIASGEYFLSEEQRKEREMVERKLKTKKRMDDKREERNKDYEEPEQKKPKKRVLQ